MREETRYCHYMGYSLRLAAMVLSYAPSHIQDSTYHSVRYTSQGALAGTRNSFLGSSIRRPIAPFTVCVCICVCVCMYVCIYVCMYVRMYVRMYICMHVCVCACVYLHEHIIVHQKHIYQSVFRQASTTYNNKQ